MSFTIVAAGNMDQVRRQVRHAVNYGPDSRLLNSLREWLLSELEHWPPAAAGTGYEPGLLIEARGHLDTTNGYLNLEIRPLMLPREGTDRRPVDH